MTLIDADVFLQYLIFSKHIDNLKCRDVKEAVEMSKVDVLDKIRVKLHATAEMHEDGDYYLREEWIDEIIDKYKTESEEQA